MACFRRSIDMDEPAQEARDALRDAGNLHTRLVRGIVTECRSDGHTRRLRFANGLAAAERIVSVSQDEMRVSRSALSERLIHHHASARVTALTPSTCRLAWSVDLLPDTAEAAVDAMVQAGLQAMKTALEADHPA
jgi:hypothetical protein